MATAIINLSSLDGSNGFRLDGTAASDYSGSSVSNAGDINGDGFDDVIVQDSGRDPHGDSSSGSSYVVFGKATDFDAALDLSSLDGSNGFRVNTESTYDYSSISSSDAGDINGDGFDDLFVRTFGHDAYSHSNGFETSYVVFGKASGFSAALDLSSLDGSNGFRVDEETSHNHSQTTIVNAGDVNGDGLEDMFIRAIGDTSNDNSFGSSYVVFGRTSGFDATQDLSSLDGSNGFLLDGVTVGGQLGFSISDAGDVNGDGFDDVIIGAPDADPHGENSGSSYVVFGQASGFDATLDLSTLDGNNGFRMDGVAEDYHLGSAVSSAGDINGDGLDDVIVDAPGANKYSYGYYTLSRDAHYVVFGKTSGFDATLDLSTLDGSNGFRMDESSASSSSVSSAGDINGDGFSDMLVEISGFTRYSSYQAGYVVFGRASGFDATLDPSSLDGSNGFHLFAGDVSSVGQNPSMAFNSAGDINDDGFDDLIVGVVDADTNAYAGSSYVVFGQASGFSATLDLFDPDSNIGVRLEGAAASDESGSAVSHAGDVNGDGFDDVIIGAPRTDPNGNNSGSSYVLFGRSEFTNDKTIRGTAGNDKLTGTPAADRFEAGNGNDSMIGRGGADMFLGGDGDDTIAVADLSFQLADGGNDTDTLKLAGGGLNLDLANFHNAINDIESIDLTGNGDNTLTLSLPDLSSLFSLGTLTVDGNAGDRVIALTNGWTDGGVDGDYRIFLHSGAVLRVNREISADVPLATNVINLADLDGNNGFRLDGSANNSSGGSVSNAGDVNGDGFDDLIIGISSADPNDINAAGSSYVVFGKAGGFAATMDLASLDGSNGFRLNGVKDYDSSGRSVSSAGDVNGDGFDDVIVSAPDADPNGERSGSSYVVFGKAAGFDATLDLSSLDGSNGFRLDGVEDYDSSGESVSSAGDVNGDGFDDVIVGAPGEFYSDSQVSGASYVVFGQASGFDATLDLSSLDGSNGFRLDGVEANDRSGYSVNTAGDVNGDGFDDVIVGATDADPNGIHNAGSSYVVFGKATGFDAAMDLSSLDGNNGFRLDGEEAGDISGFSVSNAGDVNSDGFDDVIVGAPNANPNGDYSGSSYVVFGKAAGFDAAINLSSLDGNNGFRLDGVTEDVFSGRSISSAGDVNGDGFDDVLVGVSFDGPYNNSGSTYVVFGKVSGFAAAMDLSSLDGNNGIRLDGVTAFGESGASVSDAGDVNGDGFDDLMVGGISGSSYVIFGRSDFGGGGGGNVIAGTPGNDVLKGTSAADIFEAGDGNDKMIGRGGADVFHGGTGDDYIQVADLGFGSVDGGSGNDTLHLDGKDLNLDLASFSNKIHGIETICLYGRGDNTLTLTAEGLLNLSDTSNTLRINGNAGDHITVQDDGWVDGGPRGSGYYHVYTHDDAVLLVGQNVAVDFA
ncbi:FG-GAP repeat protein [Nitrosomonas sp. Nm84]|uniref:beta strand repeat-containing protein n=1 Tax=Nitrosomonas sp. Nm84 TaxID=200124 RepID=UPI000D760E73|nr:FG-GAP repeat protein [Nitrosomonas sp. Nm84]PXW89857.1 FG-GAP repeat protein [Nitrosomonas sp. Nm84]